MVPQNVDYGQLHEGSVTDTELKSTVAPCMTIFA